MSKRLGELGVGTDVVAADKILVQQSAVDKQVVVSELPVPLNYIAGLITSNDAGDTDHDIAIAPGIARSDDDVTNLKLAAILTKQIDAIWAVGDDAGGMDTGAVAVDSLYAIWLIKRSDTAVVDALFSLSFTAPTMPTDYDSKRLIGAVKTSDPANIIGYTQVGDYFQYMDLIGDVLDTTMVDGVYETGTLSAPPDSLAHIWGLLLNTTETSDEGILTIQPVGFTESVLDGAAFSVGSFASATFKSTGGSGMVLLDGSSQMIYACSETAGAATVSIRTQGFTMFTRRDP